MAASLVSGTQGQVRRLHFPDVFRLEPHIGLMLVTGGVGIEGFGAVDDNFFELGMEFLEYSFGEPGPDVADGFVSVGVAVVAGQQERTVYRCTLASAIVCT